MVISVPELKGHESRKRRRPWCGVGSVTSTRKSWSATHTSPAVTPTPRCWGWNNQFRSIVGLRNSFPFSAHFQHKETTCKNALFATKRPSPTYGDGPLQQRRARDSNPQPLAGHHISSVAASHSLTLREFGRWYEDTRPTRAFSVLVSRTRGKVRQSHAEARKCGDNAWLRATSGTPGRHSY